MPHPLHLISSSSPLLHRGFPLDRTPHPLHIISFSSPLSHGGFPLDGTPITSNLEDIYPLSTSFFRREDGVTSIKRRRRNPSSDDVRDLATALGRG
ncbi:hypothetical protein Tco_0110200 [Tanacetum coccineum]